MSFLSRQRILAVGLVAVGGALGATLRYLTGAIAGGALATTLVVNALGSVGLGLLLFAARTEDLLTAHYRYLFGTGMLASFTTYSTFVADVASVSAVVAIGYVVASYAAGFGGIVVSAAAVTHIAHQYRGDDR